MCHLPARQHQFSAHGTAFATDIANDREETGEETKVRAQRRKETPTRQRGKATRRKGKARSGETSRRERKYNGTLLVCWWFFCCERVSERLSSVLNLCFLRTYKLMLAAV